jgi:hypothetical protein
MAKLNWVPSITVDLKRKLRALHVKQTTEIRQQLGDLTYGECDAFATELAKTNNAQRAITVLGAHWKGCTLLARVSKEEETTWAQRCKEEAQFNR